MSANDFSLYDIALNNANNYAPEKIANRKAYCGCLKRDFRTDAKLALFAEDVRTAWIQHELFTPMM